MIFDDKGRELSIVMHMDWGLDIIVSGHNISISINYSLNYFNRLSNEHINPISLVADYYDHCLIGTDRKTEKLGQGYGCLCLLGLILQAVLNLCKVI